MISEIRIIAIAAAAAFLVSALTGLLNQVSFGALVLRAVLSGAFFAAIAACAVFFARKYLPEIFGESGPELTSAPGLDLQDTEHRLNIVLPGDGEDAEDVETLPEAVDPGSVGEEELRDLERDAAEIGTDSLVPAEEESETPQPSSARPPASFEELDVLPDLDGLSDVFTGAPREDITAGEPLSRDPISTTGASRDGVDALAMAQAVRTLLKRDQKG